MVYSAVQGIGVCVNPPTATPVWIWVLVACGAAAFVALGAYVAYSTTAKRRRIQKIMQSVPQGEVTLVFTDIQGSTSLWETYPEMQLALEIHNTVMRRLIEKHGMMYRIGY